MTNIHKLIACGAIAFALSGCGASGGASAPSPTTIAPVASNVLQLGVGTVNLFGTANGAVNIVATYRQPAGSTAPGDSGTLVNSPTLTFPAAIPAGAGAPAGTVEGFDATSTVAFGAAPNEVGGLAAGATSQTSGSCGVTTFGQSGGVFGLGIEPFNAQAQGDCTPAGVAGNGTPFQVNPYPVPIYDTTNLGCTSAPLCDPNQLDHAWGGPPAVVLKDSNGDSVVGNSNFLGAGISLGIDVFQMPAPAAVAGGKYTLALSVPANTGTVTASKSVTLAAANDMGTSGAAPPFVEDGTGGGSLTIVPPAGATAWTEAVVEVIDYPAADATGGGKGIYYTMIAKNGATGVGCTAALLCTLPDAIGPAGGASITAGDFVVTQVIWTDYPIYELQYGIQTGNSGGNPAPTIAGAAGTTDMSITTATCEAAGVSCTATLPYMHARARGNSFQRGITTIRRK